MLRHRVPIFLTERESGTLIKCQAPRPRVLPYALSYPADPGDAIIFCPKRGRRLLAMVGNVMILLVSEEFCQLPAMVFGSFKQLCSLKQQG